VQKEAFVEMHPVPLGLHESHLKGENSKGESVKEVKIKAVR
jgi:hypothetical protein